MASNKTSGISTVMYIGHSTNHFVCEVCNRKIIRGFLYEDKNKRACSKNCLTQLTQD